LVSRQRRRDKGQQLNRKTKQGCRLEDPSEREREREETLQGGEASKVGKRQQGRRAAGRGTCSLLISQVFLADLPSPASLICGLLLPNGVSGALLLLPDEHVFRPFLGDSA
jgi:hypothetical protein